MIKLYLVCFCVLIVLVFTTIDIRNESSSFFGLADTTEIILNSESPVEIKKIRIIPGQYVNKGDTLVELSSYLLDIRINEISHQLAELTTRTTAQKKLTLAQIRQIKLEQESKINELKAQQQTLQAQNEFNQKMLDELNKNSMKGNRLGKGENGDSTSPVMIQLKNLNKQLQQTQDSVGILIDQVRQAGSYEGDPIADQIRRSQGELRMLEDEKKKLFIVSTISGLVGSVNFKNGERVPPFTTIATMHAQYPMVISGYIHENSYSKIKVGQSVKIESLTESKETIIGTVTGVGSRIVEYPVRLRRIPEVQMWGREIVIKIPEGNHFLMGEKVIISIMTPKKIPFLGVLREYSPFHNRHAEQRESKTTAVITQSTKESNNLRN